MRPTCVRCLPPTMHPSRATGAKALKVKYHSMITVDLSNCTRTRVLMYYSLARISYFCSYSLVSPTGASPLHFLHVSRVARPKSPKKRVPAQQVINIYYYFFTTSRWTHLPTLSTASPTNMNSPSWSLAQIGKSALAHPLPKPQWLTGRSFNPAASVSPSAVVSSTSSFSPAHNLKPSTSYTRPAMEKRARIRGPGSMPTCNTP